MVSDVETGRTTIDNLATLERPINHAPLAPFEHLFVGSTDPLFSSRLLDNAVAEQGKYPDEYLIAPPLLEEDRPNGQLTNTDRGSLTGDFIFLGHKGVDLALKGFVFTLKLPERDPETGRIIPEWDLSLSTRKGDPYEGNYLDILKPSGIVGKFLKFERIGSSIHITLKEVEQNQNAL